MDAKTKKAFDELTAAVAETIARHPGEPSQRLESAVAGIAAAVETPAPAAPAAPAQPTAQS